MDYVIDEPTTPICHVLALPFPARGHVNPMMNLCRSLASKKPDILITLVVTKEWSELISSESRPNNIHFAAIPNALPLERSRIGEVTVPNFIEEVLMKMEAPVKNLLHQIEPPTTIIIADSYLTWAFDIANSTDIPIASFWTSSVPVFSVFHHFDLLIRNHNFSSDTEEQQEDLVKCIPGIPSIHKQDLPMCLYGEGREILHRGLEGVASVSKAQFLLLCSVYELEHQVIDALKSNIPLPIYHIGPTIPYLKLKEENASDNTYLQWLDMQPRKSVLYISHGSSHSVSSAQLEEIAAGLRDSGVRYLWVARENASRFKDCSGDMGLVVPWCDQLRVLCHYSTGGFWSHCGWGSTSEAIFAGVPMLTLPLYWDQTTNSKLIVEDWKIGWRVMDVTDTDKLVTREEIASLVRRFMDVESNNEVKEMRRRAKELSEICHQAIEDGGSSDCNITAFVNEISKCHKH